MRYLFTLMEHRSWCLGICAKAWFAVSLFAISSLSIADEPNFTRMAREVFPATVKLVGKEGSRRGQVGTGFVILHNNNKFILTNEHVVRDVTKVEVFFYDGNGRVKEDSVETTRIYRDVRTDIAVVKLEAADEDELNNITPLEFHDPEANNRVRLAVGNQIMAMGVGVRGAMGPVFGRIRRLGVELPDEDISYQDFIELDARINRGNSGGPVFDTQKKVIGVVTIRDRQTRFGYAVSSTIAKRIAIALATNGSVARGYLGVRFEGISRTVFNKLNIKGYSAGIQVTEVLDDSPADTAGFQAGDVIVEFGGERVTTERAFAFSLAGTSPRSRVTVKVYRNRVFRELRPVFGALSDDESEQDEENSTEQILKIEVRGLRTAEDLAEATDLGHSERRLRQLVTGTSRQRYGVLVTRVLDNSPVSRLGIQAGTILLSVNQNRIFTPETLETYLDKVDDDQDLLLQVLLPVGTGGRVRYVRLAR